MRDFRFIEDRRKNVIARNKIVVENIAISNINSFNENMHQKGYSDFTNNFLIKQFNDIQINITKEQERISAITGYNAENEIIDIPQDILDIVHNDIEESNR